MNVLQAVPALLRNPAFWAGVVVAIVTLAIIFPDKWSVWIAQRRNVPAWLAPVAAIALLIGLANLIYGMGGAFLASLRNVSIDPWVWWLLLIGAAVLAVCVIIARRSNVSLMPRRRRPQNSSITID